MFLHFPPSYSIYYFSSLLLENSCLSFRTNFLWLCFLYDCSPSVSFLRGTLGSSHLAFLYICTCYHLCCCTSFWDYLKKYMFFFTVRFRILWLLWPRIPTNYYSAFHEVLKCTYILICIFSPYLLIFIIICYVLPLSPLIHCSPQQSPHWRPCPRVLFPFHLIPPHQPPSY